MFSSHKTPMTATRGWCSPGGALPPKLPPVQLRTCPGGTGEVTQAVFCGRQEEQEVLPCAPHSCGLPAVPAGLQAAAYTQHRSCSRCVGLIGAAAQGCAGLCAVRGAWWGARDSLLPSEVIKEMPLKPFTYPLPETRFLHAGGVVYKFKIRYGNLQR